MDQMHLPMPNRTTQHSLPEDKEQLSNISECLSSLCRHSILGGCLGV
jgi:hypothetical protein